jgi:dTMP kinase
MGKGARGERFITLEGGEGAGKSTQARLLAERLRQLGFEAVQTREPGGTPGAEAIRSLLVEGETRRWDAATEALLHFAARRDHLRQVVWPALDGGRFVVSDRFADSTMAYQGYAMKLGREAVEKLYAVAVGDFRPGLTLVLDLDAEQGQARAQGRGAAGDRYERMGLGFHRTLREAFLDIAKREPQRCRVIDAGGSVDGVARLLWAAVAERYSLAP